MRSDASLARNHTQHGGGIARCCFAGKQLIRKENGRMRQPDGELRPATFQLAKDAECDVAHIGGPLPKVEIFHALDIARQDRESPQSRLAQRSAHLFSTSYLKLG